MYPLAPELRVSSHFENMCCNFDKKSSLCANYPKGWGSNFSQWMKDNHIGELLFHVERACKGRMDVVLMASMAIYWNRNYCVDFLELRKLLLPNRQHPHHEVLIMN